MGYKYFLKNFSVSIYEIISDIIFALPRGIIPFSYIKKYYLQLFGAKVGNLVSFYPGIKISTGENLVIGNRVNIAWGVIITTSGGVTIGNRVHIGYNTVILSGNHVVPMNTNKIFFSGHVNEPITIESDVWIGANCSILPGVKIGEGAVIGAGSVVTKNIEPYSIAVGNPAKPIKNRLR
jgi:acetyltransferase-like isoleucine patch superfamily enzyme